jgi:hypothetical protein
MMPFRTAITHAIWWKDIYIAHAAITAITTAM